LSRFFRYFYYDFFFHRKYLQKEDIRMKLYDFSEGDRLRVSGIATTPDRRRLYDAFGIFEGADIRIFLISGKKVILTAGVTKLALSAKAASEISAEKI